MAASKAPLIVGLGGTTRDGSSTERAVRHVLAAAERAGARTVMFTGSDLALPLYAPEQPERTPDAELLVETLRAADGIVIASPAYHGSVSGLIKNALDYVEDMRDDAEPYFDGRAVGCITCAYGVQAAGTTLVALRSIVHALRGWPTPLGVAINSAECRFSDLCEPSDADVARQLTLLAEQVVAGARTLPRQHRKAEGDTLETSPDEALLPAE